MQPSVEAVGRSYFGSLSGAPIFMLWGGQVRKFTVPLCVPMASVGQENYLLPSHAVASFPVVSGNSCPSVGVTIPSSLLLCHFLCVSVSVPVFLFTQGKQSLE